MGERPSCVIVLDVKNQNSELVMLGRRKELSILRQRDGVELLGFAMVFLPVLLMMLDGAFANVSFDVNWWGLLNRISALAGTALLLVHITLVSRIPWVERVIGLDKMTAAHRKLGKPVLYLLAAHAASASLEYAMRAGVAPIDALVYLVADFWTVLLALIGLALMIVVVISSIRITRRRLSYEAWYLVHLTSYIAILLTIPHQFELGTDFFAQPLVTSYFTFLYVFVFSNLLWYRILQPVIFSAVSSLRVSKVVPEANQTTSITISGKRLASLGAEAGQFFMLRVLTPSQWWRPHPFSVSQAPGSEIRFTVGNRGDDTALLQRIPVGTKVILEGPYGVFSESKRSRQYVTLIAAGIGVAPIRALAESLAAKPGDVTVIYRVLNDDQAALLQEVVRISAERGHVLQILRGPRANGGGFLPEDVADVPARPDYVRLLELAPLLLESDIYICGPSQWSKLVREAVTRLRAQSNQIHIEEFAW